LHFDRTGIFSSAKLSEIFRSISNSCGMHANSVMSLIYGLSVATMEVTQPAVSNIDASQAGLLGTETRHGPGRIRPGDVQASLKPAPEIEKNLKPTAENHSHPNPFDHAAHRVLPGTIH
jgi:hypothetical protein